MPTFDPYRELWNGKRYIMNTNDKIGENGSIENDRMDNPSENIGEDLPEDRLLTHEAVNEQMKKFIVPLTRQLKELTRLVRGMVTTPLPSNYPRAKYSAISGAAVHQPDKDYLEMSNIYT